MAQTNLRNDLNLIGGTYLVDGVPIVPPGGNVVTVGDDQTITGKKTFQKLLTDSGGTITCIQSGGLDSTGALQFLKENTAVVGELKYDEGADTITFNSTTANGFFITEVAGVTVNNIQIDTGALLNLRDELSAKALKSTQILSSDSQMINVLNPTLGDDVTLDLLTNIAFGLVKLDAAGLVPANLLPFTGLNFKGVYDATTPLPSSPSNGDLYIISKAGVQTVFDPSAGVVQPTLLNLYDFIIFDTANAFWIFIDRSAITTIAAANVTVVPSGLLTTDVQTSLEALDADKVGLTGNQTIDGIKTFKDSSGTATEVRIEADAVNDLAQLFFDDSTGTQKMSIGFDSDPKIDATGLAFSITSNSSRINNSTFINGDSLFYPSTDGVPTAALITNGSGDLDFSSSLTETAFNTLDSEVSTNTSNIAQNTLDIAGKEGFTDGGQPNIGAEGLGKIDPNSTKWYRISSTTDGATAIINANFVLNTQEGSENHSARFAICMQNRDPNNQPSLTLIANHVFPTSIPIVAVRLVADAGSGINDAFHVEAQIQNDSGSGDAYVKIHDRSFKDNQSVVDFVIQADVPTPPARVVKEWEIGKLAFNANEAFIVDENNNIGYGFPQGPIRKITANVNLPFANGQWQGGFGANDEFSKNGVFDPASVGSSVSTSDLNDFGMISWINRSGDDGNRRVDNDVINGDVLIDKDQSGQNAFAFKLVKSGWYECSVFFALEGQNNNTNFSARILLMDSGNIIREALGIVRVKNQEQTMCFLEWQGFFNNGDQFICMKTAGAASASMKTSGHRFKCRFYGQVTP